MSWYNNQNQGFIDATQELQSGTSQTIINEIGEISDVFIPKVLDEQNATTDTIIVNNTANSRIFLKNQNTTPKIKIEGGKLYLYYDYDLTNAPTITAGWIDVDNYITAIKQSVIGIDVILIPLELYVFGTSPTQLQGQLLALGTITQTHTAQIANLEEITITQSSLIAELRVEMDYLVVLRFSPVSPLTPSTFNTQMLARRLFYEETTRAAIQNAGQSAMGSAVARFGSAVASKTFDLATSYLNYVLVGLGGAGVVVGLLFQLWDSINDENNINLEKKLLLLYEKLGDNPANDLPKHIHINGLLIIESTNNGLTTIGNYTITLSNTGILIIEVKLVGTDIKAVIKEVKEVGTGTFNINNIINIPKSQIGGTSGDLQIQITSLISERQVIINELAKIKLSKETVSNRRRLRDGIIKTDELGDGLTTVYNSSITNAETGEVLQVPTIKLNLNSTQLETISGVLNIKKYINSDDLAKIHEILLPAGETITSDYKLNLGYKEIFKNYPYDLIMMAIKSDTYTTFSATNYNNDYLGYFPNMSRLALESDAKVINTTSLTANSSQHFTKGFIYIKNTNELKTFNMNRKFEFVSFLKFSSFNNNTTDYHIIQTGVDLGGQIEINNTKLSVFIRNRKLKVKHPALVSYGVYTTGSLNSITTRLLGAIEYFILEPITISGVPYNDKIRIVSTPMGSGYDDYKYELKMLNVPYRLNNQSEFINTPTGFIRIVNANDTTQPAFDTRFIAMYLNHPSVASTTIANCIYPTISYMIGIKTNGDVFLDPDWNIQRIILRFDILFHRTQDQNFEGAPEYWPWPVLYQENAQITDYNTDFTFRLRYSVDGINYITHDFTMNNVTGSAWENGATSTGTTIRTGWYNNMDMPKRYWTYTYTIPNTYPIYGQKVRFVDFTLVKKPNWNYLFATTAENPYQKQPVLHLYEFKLEEYSTTENQQIQVIANNYETIETSSVLASLSNTPWYLFNLQLDLPNNSIGYYINDTFNNFTSRTPFKLYPADITMPDPAVPFVNATFVSWANLTQDNSLLVIGNIPSTGAVHFTHFNWKYFQSTEQFLTLAQVQKLMGLITYNYYYDYVSVDKLLDTNEISANRILTKQLVVNNNSLINGFTSATRSRDLRSDQTQEAGNILIKTANLYVENPPSYNGNLYYNYLTKTFTIRSVSGRSDEDDNIRMIINASAGTGLQWNATNNTLNVIPESLWQDLTPIYTSISTNDTNVSNYVWTTSNYLKSEIDGILPYDDTAVYEGITTTSNILYSDFIARDAILVTDYIARDDIIVTDSIERDDNLSASIEANKYTDAKVATYLGNTDNKTINGVTTAGGNFKMISTNKIQFEAGTAAIPAIITGGTGAKIIYYPSETTFPYSVGVSPSTLWQSIPAGAQHQLQVGGVECFRSLVNQTVISSTNENVNAILGLGTPFPQTSKYGSAIIAEAWNSYSRSNLCLCVNNTANNFNSASLANVRMRIWYFSYTEFYGTGTSTQTNYSYMLIGQSTNAYAFTTHSVSVKVNGAIWATGVIATSSSREIKKDIEELEDRECLDKLLRLKPCKYRYIDNKRNFHPTKKVFGFIAEEVKEVLPEAVDDTLKELIPNIYELGTFEGDILTISKPLELNVEYTCYAEENDDVILITILEDLGDGKYKINKTYETKTSLLVYGKTISNFHALKKEYFHAIVISSIQEHHKIIIEQKNKINDLETRLAKLEAVVSGILSGNL